MARFQFAPTTLKQLLTTRYFSVPRYQRSYSWTSDEIQDFWQDVVDAAEDSAEYFLGNVVLTEDAEKDQVYSIIDGQQRIATTTILLAAMRDHYNKHGKSDVAQAIQNTELYPLDTGTYEKTPRLQLNAIDNQFYREYILESLDVAPEKDSHQLIAEAKSYFDKMLDVLHADHPGNWSEELGSISTFLKVNARVVSVDAASDADAFIIFETLNDRGADLTIADLLKNYLFSRSGNEIDSVQQNWMESVSILEEYQSADDYITFLRHFWSSVHGMTRERELYRKIKSEIASKTSAVKFANDIRRAAKHYGAALSADSDFWTGYGERTKDIIRLFPRMKLEQNRPLLLAIFQHFPKHEIETTLQSLLAWSVRGLVGGVMGKGAAEKAFCDAAVKIRNGEIKDQSGLRDALQKLIPGDTSFAASFKTFRTTNNALARYMLLAIERNLGEQHQPEFIPNADVDDVNLEHILPQRAKKQDWPKFDDDQVTFFANRISNMTLLKKGKNSKIGNKAWSIKQPVIAESDLQLNKEISTVADWDQEAIESRGQMLADRAPHVWSL